MYRHDLGTRKAERPSMNHIVDMMNISMFADEATSSLVMIGLGVVNLVRVITLQLERCCFKWEFTSFY
jgi:hypothetical protein